MAHNEELEMAEMGESQDGKDHNAPDSSDSEGYDVDPRTYPGVWQKIKHWRGPVPGLRRANTPASITFAYVLLVIAIAMEIYLATVGIMLSVDESNKTWIVFISTTWPRVAFFLVASILLDPFRFWVQWIKVDGALITGLASIIAYGFFVESDPADNAGLRRAAIACYGPLILSLSGHIRVMAKYFPWHQYSIWVYKLVRGYHVLFYVITELVTEENETEEEDAALARHSKMHLVWIIVTLEYLHQLFDIVLEKETELHEEKRHKRRKREKKKSQRH